MEDSIRGTLGEKPIDADRGSSVELSQNNGPSLAAFLLYLGIVLSPNAMLFNVRLVEGFSLTPLRLIILALLIAVVFSRSIGKSKPLSSINRLRLFIPLLTLLAIKLFSLLYTQNFPVGLKMFEGFLEMFLVATLYFFFYQKGILKIERIVYCLVLGLLISLFFSFLQINNLILHFNILPSISSYLIGITGQEKGLLIRVIGAYSFDANSYSFYLASMIIVMFMMALRLKGAKYLVLVFIISLSLITSFTTQSLSGLIAFSIAALFFLVKENPITNRRFITTLLYVVIILLIPFVLFQSYLTAFLENYTPRYREFIEVYESRTLNPNMEMHKQIQTDYIDLINKKPEYLFLGAGEGDYSFLTRGIEVNSSAHNAFLLIFAENGIIGLLMIVYLSWLILKESWKLSRRSTAYMARSFFYINLVFILSLLFYGSTFTNYYFWIIIGLTFGMSQQEGMRAKNGIEKVSQA